VSTQITSATTTPLPGQLGTNSTGSLMDILETPRVSTCPSQMEGTDPVSNMPSNTTNKFTSLIRELRLAALLSHPLATVRTRDGRSSTRRTLTSTGLRRVTSLRSTDFTLIDHSTSCQDFHQEDISRPELTLTPRSEPQPELPCRPSSSTGNTDPL